MTDKEQNFDTAILQDFRETGWVSHKRIKKTQY